MTDRLYDPGAALERTSMAWSRTGLGVLATAALGARLELDDAPWLALALMLVGTGGAVALHVVSRRRYARLHRALWEAGPDASPGAQLALPGARLACALVVLLSVLAALTAA